MIFFLCVISSFPNKLLLGIVWPGQSTCSLWSISRVFPGKFSLPEHSRAVWPHHAVKFIGSNMWRHWQCPFLASCRKRTSGNVQSEEGWGRCSQLDQRACGKHTSKFEFSSTAYLNYLEVYWGEKDGRKSRRKFVLVASSAIKAGRQWAIGIRNIDCCEHGRVWELQWKRSAACRCHLGSLHQPPCSFQLLLFCCNCSTNSPL